MLKSVLSLNSQDMQTARLVSKTFLNEQVIELKLATEKLETLPGQRLFIHYLGVDQSFKRAYSIANVEEQEGISIFTFLIKLIEGGKGSKILRIADENTKLGLEGPNGHFILSNTKNPKCFLSTGSGLAPCYRIAKADKSGASKWFYFSVSYAKDLFYVQQIEDLGIKETHISLSREEVKGFESGRITIDHIKFPEETEFYICGVPAMVKEFMTQLKARGYKNIFVEAY